MYFEALASGGGSDWYYTILMKAPLGAKITVDDGDEEVEATGAGMDTIIGIPVHNDSSTYTVSVEMNGLTAPTSSITTPATSGGISSIVEVPFAKISLTYDDEFRGQSMSMTDGTHTASPSPVLPVLGNTVDVYVPYTGNWTLEATDPVSGNQFNSSPNPVPIVSLDQTINAGLYVIPDGKTVLPVNDIETWLLCADIKDVSYTTLAEVLADEDVLRRLLTDDNAIDYLKRSTGWINSGLVPSLTSDNGKITVSSNYSQYSYPYKAFDGNWDKSPLIPENNGWCSNGLTNQWIAYEFDTPQNIRSIKIRDGQQLIGSAPGALTINNFKVQYSDIGGNNDADWTDEGTALQYTGTTGVLVTAQSFNLTDKGEHKYWRVYFIDAPSNVNISIANLQFYEYSYEGIPESETAMSYIGAYDYAADTLLSDSDWFDALYTSEYSEKVITTVPTMTDDTHPSGECFYGWANVGTESPSDYRNPYLAFDGDDTTRCFTKYANPSYDQWIGYDFKKPIRVVAARLINCNWSGTYRAKNVFIKASNDRNTYTAISSDYTMPESSDPQIIKFNNNLTAYNNWAVHIKDAYVGTDSGTGINEIQFYGREAGGVQTLLKAAGVARPYTTLEELLADKEALAMVIGSHAAIDYLVTVKDWIDEFTSNEMAMLFIGGDNYAADTLLGDADWAGGIAASSYVDYVLNSKVPKMSSNTSPKGRVFYASQNATYVAYRAFNDTKNWTTNVGQTPPVYIGYIFETPTTLKYLYCTEWGYSSGGFIDNFVVQGSPDTTNGVDGTWDDLSEAITFPSTGASAPHSLVINNNTPYKAYRLYSTTATVGSAGSIQFYCRDDVTEGVHIFSAASDTIYDQDNNVIATTDTSGHALVSKSSLPNGTYTLRSTVAKDPDNLSNDFTKVVKVTDDTKAIFLMPDNTLYWYGFEDSGLEDCNAANGWTTSAAYGTNGPTRNTQCLFMNTGSNADQGVGTKNVIKSAGNVNAIAKGTSLISGANYFGVISASVGSKIVHGSAVTEYIEFTGTGSIKKFTQDVSSLSNFYTSVWTTYGGVMDVYGFWLDKHNPLANFFSAANDLIYYISGGVHVPVAKTNSLGEAVIDFGDIPAGATLYSSVAKDPDDPNLSNPYTKAFSPVNGKFYLMPDQVAYWWGWKDNCELVSTENGWTGGVYTFAPSNVTFYDNYIYLPEGAYHVYNGIGSKIALHGSSAKQIISMPTQSTYILRPGAESTKICAPGYEGNHTIPSYYMNDDAKSLSEGDYYLSVANMQSYGSYNIYALWIE